MPPMRQTSLQKAQGKLLFSTQEERRKSYKCGPNYVTLQGLQTWPEYYRAMADNKKIEPTGDFKSNSAINDKISLWRGDITTLEVDAIVNPAKQNVIGGGGLDDAIHAAAGKYLMQEFKAIGGCDTGDAKITQGYQLPAERVIHTVSPTVGDPQGCNLLRRCYKKCLQIVKEKKIKTVALPCIGRYIYGFTKNKSAEIALETVRKWLANEDNAKRVKRIIFCLHSDTYLPNYERLLQEYFPVSDLDDLLPASIEERRRQYWCGSDYVMPENIKKWSDHYEEMPDSKKKQCTGTFKGNRKLSDKISVLYKDITRLEVDAIVNPADESLLGGKGGIAASIHAAAGGKLKEACQKLKGCDIGNAKITLGYKLPAKKVIHAVAPRVVDPGRLRKCYEACLAIVKNQKLKTVAFPCLSTNHAFPIRRAAPVALRTVREWLENNIKAVDRIIFCVRFPNDVSVYEEFLQEYFPVPKARAKRLSSASSEDMLEESEQPSGSSPERPSGSSPKRPSGSSPKRPSGSSPKRPSGSSRKRPSGSSPKRPSGSSRKRPSGSSPKQPSGSSPKRPSGSSPGGTSPKRRRVSFPNDLQEMKIEEFPRDGRSLYRALSLAHFGMDGRRDQIRLMIFDCIVQRPEVFTDLIHPRDGSAVEYAYQVLMGTTTGTEADILAFCLATGNRVSLCTTGRQGLNWHHFPVDPPVPGHTPIMLYYDGYGQFAMLEKNRGRGRCRL